MKAPTTRNNPIILIIDDEPAILKMLKDALEEEAYLVYTLSDPTKAVDLIGEIVPDLVLLDIFMPQLSGLDVLSNIRQEYPAQNIMVISGFGTIAMALEAIRLGATDFIEKPLSLDDIFSKIAYLKQDEEKSNDGLLEAKVDYEAFGIIGKSYLFQELMHSVNQVACLDLPLLLYGEYGVGKSLIAAFSHQKKNGTNDFFYCYDAQRETSLEPLKKQLSEQPKGTLFIKNLHNVPLKNQHELLVQLQSADHAHLRMIASSCDSLFDRVQDGSFYSGLFNYFNIIPLEIPSINKRRYDIPLLVHHFLQRENREQVKNVLLSTASIRMLRNVTWSGNVAQLQSFIKIMVTAAPLGCDTISPEFLERYLPDILPLEEQRFTQFTSFSEAVLAFEKEFLLYSLKKNKYDLEQVSDSLRLNISQLRDRMLELQISYKR